MALTIQSPWYFYEGCTKRESDHSRLIEEPLVFVVKTKYQITYF